jgi:hypothetical protein
LATHAGTGPGGTSLLCEFLLPRERGRVSQSRSAAGGRSGGLDFSPEFIARCAGDLDYDRWNYQRRHPLEHITHGPKCRRVNCPDDSGRGGPASHSFPGAD